MKILNVVSILVKTVQMLLMAIQRGQRNLDIFKTAVTVDLNNGW